MSRAPRRGLTAGIDVSLKELAVAWRNRKGDVQVFTEKNTPEGHRRLTGLFGGKGRFSRIVIEATGTFHIDLAIALATAPGVELMVVNPLAARRFAEAQMKRAKTDRVDALMLLEFCERMEFVTWTPPRQVVLDLRAVGRHLTRLVAERVAIENQIAANRATRTTPSYLLSDLADALAACEARIERCQAEALRIVAGDPDLAARHAALTSVKGIKDRAALQLGSEFALLDETMTPDEVVAHAGLDPRPFQSGMRDPVRRTSKVGNVRLRAALYLPAMTAARHSAPVREWYESLTARGKPPLVALTAVARRLLRAVWIIYRTKTAWNDALFRPRPPKGAAPVAHT